MNNLRNYNFIKIFDPEKAIQLSDLGFKYTLDRMNNQIVYAFFESEELLNVISNFDSHEYFKNNTLHF